MCLVALQDPGLTVFPTHRLLTGLDDGRARGAARRDRARLGGRADRRSTTLEPTPGDGPVRLGYLDAHHQRPLRLTLRDQAIADAALAGKPEPYRRARHRRARGADPQGRARHDRGRHLALQRPRLRALDRRGARADRESGDVDAAFFMGATPVDAGPRRRGAPARVMPPKSTYFFPKVLTGLLFNPLDEE